jgi:hypothetical protein
MTLAKQAQCLTLINSLESKTPKPLAITFKSTMEMLFSLAGLHVRQIVSVQAESHCYLDLRAPT